MPSYKWNFKDDDSRVTCGSGAGNPIKYVGPIGGGSDRDYNVRFVVSGSQLGEYHIHFATGSRRVVAIRYKQHSADPKGDNIVNVRGQWKTKELKNLRALQLECNGFPNHVQLLENLRLALPAEL